MKHAVVGLSVLLVSAAVAQAQPRESDRSHVSVDVGLAMPLGQLGIEGTYVAHPSVEVGVGVGIANIINIGDTGSPDPQVAIMPRFRLPLGAARFSLGVGASGGPYTVGTSPFDGDPYAAKMKLAVWLNGEAGVEYVRSGFLAGAFLGYGKIIAHSEATDSNGDTLMSVPDDALPYVGVKLGHTF